MNFRKIAVLALAATSFAINAHAANSVRVRIPEVPLTSRVQLGIESVCGQRAHLYDIHNIGNVTSGVLTYRVTAAASEEMPAMYTWVLRLMPLQPGQTFQLTVPRAAWGLKVSVKFDAAPGLGVTQSGPTAVSYPSFCW